MKKQTLVKKYLPQNPDIEVLVPNYKEPILPVNHGGFGWYGLQAFNEQGQLMCHECGGFWDSLGRHVCKHGLNPKEYRLKYGLLMRTRLVSEKTYQNHRHSIERNPELLEKIKERCKGFKGNPHPGNNGHGSMAYKNMKDTCPAQLIRWLINLAEIYGPNITKPEVGISRPGLPKILQREFGSFNKAKQLARLVNNPAHSMGEKTYNKELILEDMCRFYSKYNRWPVRGDYMRGEMICGLHPIFKNGGMIALRQEAMKLRQEQEAAREMGETLDSLAQKIQMENAGRAMR